MTTAHRPWKALLLSLLMTAAGVVSLSPRAPVAWVATSFFGACTLVLLWATVTGGHPRCPGIGRVGGPASAPSTERARTSAFSPEELARRRPVWSALSDLFLDTELQPDDHVRIARMLRDSGYADATLLAILDEEVAPICGPNLLSVAGEWALFDGEWLEHEILRLCGASTLARKVNRWGGGLMRRAVAGDLAAVRAALVRLRQDPAALAHTLTNAGPEERLAACREIAFLGRDAAVAASAVQAAARADPDPEVRAASVDAAWRIARLAALDVALAATGDPSPSVRGAAVAAIAEAAVDPPTLARAAPAEAPDSARAAATGMLREPDPSARKVGATALGVLAALGAPGALEAALGALDEEDEAVRIALGRTGALAGAGESALAPVVSALADPRPSVSRTAAQVMVFAAQREGAAARWALAPLLAAVRSRDPVVRRLAAIALGWLRETAADARPFLVQGVDAADPDLRAACLGALARVDAALGSPPLEVLFAALGSSDRTVRNAAYFALFDLGAAAAPLLPRLEAMARERRGRGALDRRVLAKVLVERIRERASAHHPALSGPSS